MRITFLPLLAAALLLPLPVEANTRFNLDFQKLHQNATIEGIPSLTSASPEAEAALTRGNSGVHGEAVIIAAEGLDAFETYAPGNLVPSYGLRFMTPEVLNPNQGSIRITFRPFYNGKYRVFENTANPAAIYYLFDSGHFDPEKPHQRINGIQILLKHTKLENQDAYTIQTAVHLASGEILRQTSPVAATPDEWHTLQLSWSMEKLALSFNDRPLMNKPITGPLAPFEEFFTIGGSWYGTWPLQGLIDHVEISGE